MAHQPMLKEHIPSTSNPDNPSGVRAALVAHGFTAVPNVLLRQQAELGLTASELVLVLQIWSYWWEEPVLPYPCVSTLASSTGSSERQIRHLLSGLAARGLIRVQPRYSTAGAQLSNAYDLCPLLLQLLASGGGAARSVGAPATLQPESTLLHQVGGGMSLAAVPPLQASAGDQDIRIKIQPDQETVIGARAPVPEGSGLNLVSQPTTERNDRDPLLQRMQQLGLHRDDRAPRATAVRLQRLRAGGVSDEMLLELLEEAVGSLTAEVERPVPYVLAVIENLATMVRRDEKCRDCSGDRPLQCASRGGRAVLPSTAAAPCGDAMTHDTLWETICSELAPTVTQEWQSEATDEPGGHPLWPAVVRALAAMMAPSVFAQKISPLRSRSGVDGALEVVAPDSSVAMWLESRLRCRIQEALDFVAPDPPAWRVVT